MTEKRELKKYLRLIVSLAALACLAIVWFFFPVKNWIQQFTELMTGLGILGVIAFCLAYACGTILLIPASLMSMAAGVAYGFWGFPVVMVGASIGASFAFLIARYSAKEKVKKYFKKNPKIRVLEEAVNNGGWKMVALLRLSPIFPFNFQNYFYGITEIGFWPYIITTFIAVIPGKALCVYLGTLTSESTQASGVKWTFYSLGMFATILAGWIIRKNIQQLTERK